MDPLNLLREWTIAGKLDRIRLGPERVEFADSYSFRRDAPTSYKSQKGKGAFYGLATLLVFLRNSKTPFPQYVKITKEENVPTVSYLDRKDVEAYLTGQSSSSDFIQLVAPDLNFAAIPTEQAVPAAHSAEPAAKRARLDAQPTATPAADGAVGAAPVGTLMQQVERYERRLWDRNSALTVPGKSFARAVQLARDVVYANSRQPEPLRSSSRPQHRGHQPAIPVKPSGRLERAAGPDTTLQEMGFKGVNIQTYGAAPTASLPPTVNGSTGVPPAPPPRPMPSNPAATPPPSAAKKRPPSHHAQRSSSASEHRPSSAKKPDQHKGMAPIIIVPKGYDTKINMFNAQAFLEEGRYVPWQECQEQGVKKVSRASFKRTIGRIRPVTYHITDVTPDKKDNAWGRVVAVFVQGKAWQFRDWPFHGASEGDMVATFDRMLGVYMMATNEQLPPLVKSWNVKVVKLHPNDRHGDMQLARDFYGFLDVLLGARKSSLAY